MDWLILFGVWTIAIIVFKIVQHKRQRSFQHGYERAKELYGIYRIMNTNYKDTLDTLEGEIRMYYLLYSKNTFIMGMMSFIREVREVNNESK